MDLAEVQIIVAIIGIFVSPIYLILIWRMKKSDKIETKVTKICTALKLKFPELTEILK